MAKRREIKERDVDLIAEVANMLGGAARMRICAHLANGSASVGELAEVSGVSVSGVSQHLAKLRAAGLVRGQRDAQTINYQLLPAKIAAMIAALAPLAEVVEPVAVKKPPAKVDGVVGKVRIVVKEPAAASDPTLPKKKGKGKNPILLGTATVTPAAPRKKNKSKPKPKADPALPPPERAVIEGRDGHDTTGGDDGPIDEEAVYRDSLPMDLNDDGDINQELVE